MLSEKSALICVIVPVYKVEPYLHCCINSILTQTFTDFKLILVDDGSPDNCGAICDEYARKDERIVVIHQENGGLSAARNAGLDWVFAHSNSEWITFVDSDDAIVPTYLAYLLHHAKAVNADVSATDVFSFWEELDFYKLCNPSSTVRVIRGLEACQSIYRRMDEPSVTAWGKLYKRTLWDTVRFPLGKIHEDDARIPQVLYKSQKVVLLSGCPYCYRIRPGSICNSEFTIKRFDRIEGIESCIVFFRKQGDGDTAKLAKKFRDEVCATTILRAWKCKKMRDIPAKYRMPLPKAVYLTLKDSIKRGGLRFVFGRLSSYLGINKDKARRTC